MIEKVLILSVLHVSSSTRDKLYRTTNPYGLLVDKKSNNGALITVYLEKTDLSLVPHDLLYLLRYAHMNDCIYLDLDPYAETEDTVLFDIYPIQGNENRIYKI